ncbi:MAG: hypothetical protein ABMA15_03410 [Vicinamibacterales bacterium]
MTDRSRTDDFSGFVEALDQHGDLFDVRDASEPRRLGVSVSLVRRRRGRLTDDHETGYRDVVLVERDGVLLWVTASDMAGTRGGSGFRRPGRRGWRRGLEGTRVLKEVSVPVLQPNEYLAALENTDRHLNKECDTGLRVVVPSPSGPSQFLTTTAGLQAAYRGRTLVIVHGTFSSSANVLGEFAATEHGARFMSDALTHYNGQVLVFDHPTLSVSPFLNALDLARRLAGTTGQLDVIAHSRGGLVTQWWVEVFGDMLSADVRVVLAGSPLRGTSLAAPDRIQPLLSLLSNVGHFVERTLQVAGAANPFIMASFALLQFLGRRERNRWGLPPVDNIGSRPGTDAAVAVIPGLQGQSAVVNNRELIRLRQSSARSNVRYYAVTADFEPERIGWKLWKVLSEAGDRSRDAVTDAIFNGPNDLVVDTPHMTSLAENRSVKDVCTFSSGREVHHCNYFRQPETIESLRNWLQVPSGAV